MTDNQKHNDPPVIVSFTRKQAEFLLENCDKNIIYGLQTLQGAKNEATATRIVELLEQFKEIRAVLKDAM